jgi:hypothetical protein
MDRGIIVPMTESADHTQGSMPAHMHGSYVQISMWSAMLMGIKDTKSILNREIENQEIRSLELGPLRTSTGLGELHVRGRESVRSALPRCCKMMTSMDYCIYMATWTVGIFSR